MALLVSGEVPNTILENGRPGDWVATLNLSGIVNPLEVRLIGDRPACSRRRSTG
ncbi:hypothetical protein [Teichococcus aestuarii]|uniref:hypothetical protein n=1 Tax=Teichococcus aestuarii TaxID=568898 RepID=UPI003621FF1B